MLPVEVAWFPFGGIPISDKLCTFAFVNDVTVGSGNIMSIPLQRRRCSVVSWLTILLRRKTGNRLCPVLQDCGRRN